jgi:Opioid growth factor receptor (OGFr) conserved region
VTDGRPDPIVAFYSGAEDAERRTLAQILEWDDDRLEMVHDYIQWVFPTRQPSGVNPLAPTVTAETIRAFAADPEVRDRLRRALDRMLVFYGLVRRGARVEIDDARFPARARVWLHPGNHNHLRLTRILDSLATLGLGEDARALQRCLLDDVAAGPGQALVSPRTVDFWRGAV